MKIDESNIVEEVHDAIANRDEKLLRDITVRAMRLFLDHKLLAEELYSIGISPVTVGIEKEWEEDFQFKDRKLRIGSSNMYLTNPQHLKSWEK